MKKNCAILLALILILVAAPTASATSPTTTLTTTVPPATYTLNIPENQTIDFGATESDIGTVTVTDSNGFAIGKDLKVTLVWDDFNCPGVTTTIPYKLAAQYVIADSSREIEMCSGDYFTFKGNSDGTVDKDAYSGEKNVYGVRCLIRRLELQIASTSWGRALGGDYTSIITYTAEVISSSSQQ